MKARGGEVVWWRGTHGWGPQSWSVGRGLQVREMVACLEYGEDKEVLGSFPKLLDGLFAQSFYRIAGCQIERRAWWFEQLAHCPSPMVCTNKDIWLVLNYDLKKKMPNFLAPMALGTFATWIMTDWLALQELLREVNEGRRAADMPRGTTNLVPAAIITPLTRQITALFLGKDSRFPNTSGQDNWHYNQRTTLVTHKMISGKTPHWECRNGREGKGMQKKDWTF